MDFARYLDAKRTVDDRALDRRVWDRLRAELSGAASAATRIADIGAGIGSGLDRMVDWKLLPRFDDCHYTAVEPDRPLLEIARRQLLRFPGNLTFAHSDLAAFAGRAENRDRFDLVVAHAVVDVLDLDRSLDSLVRITRPNGLLYLPITFDGMSLFEPPHAADASILDSYHATMKERGDSRTGRRLLAALRRRGAEILEVASSDWTVFASREGYPNDEAYFLFCIVETIEGAVHGRIEAPVAAWASERRRQIDAGELFYVAHQLDYLARKSA